MVCYVPSRHDYKDSRQGLCVCVCVCVCLCVSGRPVTLVYYDRNMAESNDCFPSEGAFVAVKNVRRDKR